MAAAVDSTCWLQGLLCMLYIIISRLFLTGYCTIITELFKLYVDFALKQSILVSYAVITLHYRNNAY